MLDKAKGELRPLAVLAILVVLSIFLILFTDGSKRQESTRFGASVVQGIQRSFGSIGAFFADSVGSVRRVRDLRGEYDDLLDRVAIYEGLERELVDLRRENTALKQHLGLSTSVALEHQSARIIGGDPSNLFSTLTIDKGTRHGIRVGSAVTAFNQGFFGLVGKVVQVGPTTSQVRPLGDPGSYVSARFQRTRHTGLVDGQGREDGLLTMRYVTKTASSEILIDDLVITSGMSDLYPPDLYIGRVHEIRSREYDTSLEIVVDPVVDFSRIEYVFVLDTPQEGWESP